MAGPATLRPPLPCAPRWHKVLAVAVLLAAAGCSGATDSPSTPRSTHPPAAPTDTGATVPAFARGRFAAVIPVPGARSLAVADGVLWVLASGGVVRIEPESNRVVGQPLRVPADAEAIAVGDGALWVAGVAPGDLATPGDDAVTRIDLATGRRVATIKVGRAPLDITVTPGAVWVTNSGGGDSVARIDPQTNRLAGRPIRTGASPQSLAAGGGSLWVANHDERTVTRIDQASGKVVADIPVPSEPHRVAYGAGAVWVGNWHDNSVSRIDPATNRVVGSPIPIGFHHAGNLVVGAGSVWVTSDYRTEGAAEDVVVVRIDPQANRAVETIAVGGHPIDVAATQGAVWVSVANPGTVLRIAGS
jgi:YVTN family beta-propeller protein